MSSVRQSRELGRLLLPHVQVDPARIGELRAAQGDRCAICGNAEPQHLDHDHKTGVTRQLLCQRCNQGLGLFRDDPKLLHAAAFYVELHTARQAVAAELAAARRDAVIADRPGKPPAESQRRPGATRPGGRTRTRRRETSPEG